MRRSVMLYFGGLAIVIVGATFFPGIVGGFLLGGGVVMAYAAGILAVEDDDAVRGGKRE